MLFRSQTSSWPTSLWLLFFSPLLFGINASHAQQTGNDKSTVDTAQLPTHQQKDYLVDEGDVLGIFIDGVVGQVDSLPGIQLPSLVDDLPPSIGTPIPVNDKGQIILPFVDPIDVRGKSIMAVEKLIKNAYRSGESPVLTDDARIIVTLQKERWHQIFVVRNDLKGASERGFILNLPASQCDVLNALSVTGGLPTKTADGDVDIVRRRLSKEDKAKLNQRQGKAGEGRFIWDMMRNLTDDSAETVSLNKLVKQLKENKNGDKKSYESIVLQEYDVLYVN